MKTILIALSIFGLTQIGHAYCEADATKAAVNSYLVSTDGARPDHLSTATILDEFNETYGEGEYYIEILDINKLKLITLSVEAKAYSDENDDPVCATENPMMDTDVLPEELSAGELLSKLVEHNLEKINEANKDLSLIHI